MFTCALGFVLPELSGNAEPQLQLVPATKVCTCCRTDKRVEDFHSKGRDRREHICKSCSNDRKTQRRSKRKRTEKKARAKNRTLALSISELIGELDSQTIDEFGYAYGSLIQELLNE
jgi:hypothetical protein